MVVHPEVETVAMSRLCACAGKATSADLVPRRQHANLQTVPPASKQPQADRSYVIHRACLLTEPAPLRLIHQLVGSLLRITG
mmetsp:Transcript_81010/g.224090  ORF Transcript_81010/g.224090 Transcript_81010/m.224090 type:complete len:82 (+) Transcript_81010:24-269(+)